MGKTISEGKGLDRSRVETRIWLSVLSLESEIFSKLNGALSAQFGISVAKFEFLAQIERYPAGISLGQISANLKVTSGNVSGLVRRLLADGLITKTMSQEDRRSFIVHFTPKGKELFDRANALHAETLARCFAEVPLPELEKALTTLRLLSSGIQGRRND
ncbi:MULTISPECIES: MarR family winged helix-turn-helix transcriptional regulator [unclassified Stappia]|uniref:MarR family winged helix-turn-helix transcriptional regulator n=1 Tax=unclassified Stappia TaxID=2629676 RepID=UPI001643B215|nr:MULTISPECIES: MarR family transcriptional regulator [unclassified Stappia]